MPGVLCEGAISFANMCLRREQALDMQQHEAACLDASAYMQQHAWMRVHMMCRGGSGLHGCADGEKSTEI